MSQDQTEKWVDRIYGAIMRAVGHAITNDVPREVNGGIVMFSATGMAAAKFLTEFFSRERAHELVNQWAAAAHESIDAHNNAKN